MPPAGHDDPHAVTYVRQVEGVEPGVVADGRALARIGLAVVVVVEEDGLPGKGVTPVPRLPKSLLSRKTMPTRSAARTSWVTVVDSPPSPTAVTVRGNTPWAL